MTYCKTCMVSYERGVEACVLCGSKKLIEGEAGAGPVDAGWFPPKIDEVLSGPEKIVRKRGLWLMILGVCAGIPAGVSIVVDMLFTGGGTWSLYVVASLGLFCSICFVFIAFMYHPVQMIVAMGVSILVHEYLLGVIAGSTVWVFGVAWPITIAATIVVLLSAIGVVLSGKNLHFSVSIILLGISALNLAIDWIIGGYLARGTLITWSSIVIIACIPVAVLLLLLGYAYKHSSAVRRILHW